MTLNYKQRDALRDLAGRLVNLAGKVNDDEDIAFVANWNGLTEEDVQKLLEIAVKRCIA